MLTKSLSQQIYTKFAGTSGAFMRTKKGKELVERAIKLVAEREGQEEADVLKNLLTVLECMP